MSPEEIAKINPAAVANGAVKPFGEQVADLLHGRLKTSAELIVAPNSAALLPAVTPEQAAYALTMAQSVVRKASSGKPDHDLSREELAGLAEALEGRNVLMMQSATRSDSIVAVLAPDTRDNLFVAVNVEARTQRRTLNRVTSVYERSDIEGLVGRTWERGLRIYPTENTRSWLGLRGLRLPPVLAQLLDDDYTFVSKTAQAPSVRNLIGRGYGPSQAALIDMAYARGMEPGTVERLAGARFDEDQSRQLVRGVRAGLSEEALLRMADPALPASEMQGRRLAETAARPAPDPPSRASAQLVPESARGQARESAKARNDARPAKRQNPRNPNHERRA